MARSNNNTMLLIVVLLLLVGLGLYCTWNRTHDNKKKNESYSHSSKLRNEKSDIEFIEQSDQHADIGDDFQLIGVAGEEPAHQIGFGMGPGLYGSGRHTSEMVGN